MLDVVGVQTPRICAVPDAWESSGDVAIEVAKLAGLRLDPWEQLSLHHGCALQSDGQWASFQFGLEAPRQNGKGSILEARELAGAFAFGERLIIHSAHEQATSSEHLRRMLALIEGVPEFDQRVLKVRRGKGEEAIELRDDYRILFKTRTGSGGRGFTGDLVVLDEAMFILETFMAALVPTMAARSVHGNPQLWLTGSAVDRLNPKHAGIPFSRLRRTALAGGERAGWLEWSVEADDPDDLTAEQLDDPELWAQANPGLGIRISAGYIRVEKQAMSRRDFAVERLGVGAWETDDDIEQTDGITGEMLRATHDPQSAIADGVVFAADVTPKRDHAAIGVAGQRRDKLAHLEVVEHHSGTDWLVARAKELQARHGGELIVDERGPIASMIQALRDAGVKLKVIGSREMADGAGLLHDGFAQQTIRHLDQPELHVAVLGAAKRPLGDAWAWSRKTSAVDISPLVAVTLAYWGLRNQKPRRVAFI